MSSFDKTNNSTLETFAVRLLQAGQLFEVIYTLILCVFGFIGNSLALLVFCLDSKYRQQPSSYYLSALAISDTGFLPNLLTVWWESMYGGIITSKIMCPLVMYLGQVACFISVYLIVVFSMERYIVIHYPLSRASTCTKSKAKKRILGIVFLALLLFSYAMVIAQVIEVKSAESHSQLKDIARNQTNASFSKGSSWSPINWIGNNIFFELETDNYLEDAKVADSMVNEIHLKKLDQPGFLYANLTTEEKFLIVKPNNLPLNNKSNILVGRNDPVTEKSINGKRDSDPNSDNHPSYVCSVPQKYYKISEVANYADMAITLVIPAILITFANVSIATSLWKIRDERKRIVTAPSSSTNVDEKHLVAKHVKPLKMKKEASGFSSLCHQHEDRNGSGESNCSSNKNSALDDKPMQSGTVERILKQNISDMNGKATLVNFVHNAANRQQQKRSAEIRVTKLLLLVSTVFLALNLPLHIVRCVQFMQSVASSAEEQSILVFVHPWANTLFNTNFAVNFLLYCASGSHFRQSLMKIMARVLQNWNHQNQSLQPTAKFGHNSKQPAGVEKCNIRNASGIQDNTWEPPTSSFRCKTLFVQDLGKEECIELQDRNIPIEINGAE